MEPEFEKLKEDFNAAVVEPRSTINQVKSESLVIANQHVAVNTFPGLVHTARHTMGVGCTRSQSPNLREGVDHGVVNDWGEVVTR